ncbi:MAG TPA: polysaccharide deacetylase family protein [Clostridia bacterium]
MKNIKLYISIISFAAIALISSCAVFFYKNIPMAGTCPSDTSSESSSNLIKDGDKLPVLMYHHVDDKDFDDRYYYVKPTSFYEQMKYLYDNEYTTLTFNEVKDYKRYKKPVLITFDDGYNDNYLNAYPVLKGFNMKATVFLIAQFIDKPEYLSKSNISKMKDVVSFQSHTNCHSNLKELDNDLIEKECIESKKIIENITGKSVIAISYPFGMYNQSVIDIAKRHYTYGITGDNGYLDHGNGTFTIKRIPVTYNETLNDFKKKFSFAN